MTVRSAREQVCSAANHFGHAFAACSPPASAQEMAFNAIAGRLHRANHHSSRSSTMPADMRHDLQVAMPAMSYRAAASCHSGNAVANDRTQDAARSSVSLAVMEVIRSAQTRRMLTTYD
jgi:hypothetical protein